MELKRILGVGQSCTALEEMNSVTTMALYFASLGHLVLISIDRYVAIKKPLRCQAIITKQRIKVGVILVWATVLFVTTIRQVLTSIKSQTNIVDVCRKASASLASILVLGSVATILYTYFHRNTAPETTPSQTVNRRRSQKNKKGQKGREHPRIYSRCLSVNLLAWKCGCYRDHFT